MHDQRAAQQEKHLDQAWDVARELKLLRDIREAEDKDKRSNKHVSKQERWARQRFIRETALAIARIGFVALGK